MSKQANPLRQQVGCCQRLWTEPLNEYGVLFWSDGNMLKLEVVLCNIMIVPNIHFKIVTYARWISPQHIYLEIQAFHCKCCLKKTVRDTMQLPAAGVFRNSVSWNWSQSMESPHLHWVAWPVCQDHCFPAGHRLWHLKNHHSEGRGLF